MTLLVITLILAALTWWAFTPPRDEFRTAHARDRWMHGLGRIYVGGGEHASPRASTPPADLTVAPASPARRGDPTGTARGGEAHAAPVGQTSKENR
jgi:hypothetical protein